MWEAFRINNFFNKNKLHVVGSGKPKILVIAASHLGNNVFCTPGIRLIKKHYPNHILDVIALNHQSAAAFEGNPDIDTIMVTKSARKLKKLAENYQIIFNLDSRNTKLVSKIGKRIFNAPNFPQNSHRADHILDFIASVIHVHITNVDRQYVMGSTACLNSELHQLLSAHKEKRIIGIHLGCGRAAIHGWKFFNRKLSTHRKIWPVENYIQLCKAITEKYKDIVIVVSGTRNESFLAKHLCAEFPNSVNLIGKTSVIELFTIIKNMVLFISHDCGVLHLAAAANIPIVGLFGATNPYQTGPYPLSEHHTIVHKESMTNINPEDVLKAADKFLS